MEDGIDLSNSLDLTFSPPDLHRFPCLQTGHRCTRRKGCAPLVFNASNEIAVEAFLSNRIGFGDISSIIDRTLNLFEHRSFESLEELLFLDKTARSLAKELIVQVS